MGDNLLGSEGIINQSSYTLEVETIPFFVTSHTVEIINYETTKIWSHNRVDFLMDFCYAAKTYRV